MNKSSSFWSTSTAADQRLTSPPMNDTPSPPSNTALHLARLGVGLAILPLTFLTLRVLGRYWTYYDIGTPVNGLTLLFVYAPIILISSILVVTLTWKALGRFRFNPWWRALVTLLILLLMLAGGLTYEMLKIADERVAPERTFWDFLVYFFQP
jgi:hypothetical protein